MSVTITFREVREWPGKKTSFRQRAPFKAHATRLWDLLDRELWKISAREVTLSGYFKARDFKRDGGIYADARPSEPGIILEFVKGKDRMRFSCDKFPAWLDNVDAIARSLEALRMMDRYGVMAGQQYEGFKAIPAKTTETMSQAEALALLASLSGVSETLIRVDGEQLLGAVRRARAKAHPDAGGSSELFHQVQRAAQLLGAAA